MAISKRKVTINGFDFPFGIPDFAQGKVKPDASLDCDNCGKNLPPVTDSGQRQANILWDHPAAGPCVLSEGALSR